MRYQVAANASVLTEKRGMVQGPAEVYEKDFTKTLLKQLIKRGKVEEIDAPAPPEPAPEPAPVEEMEAKPEPEPEEKPKVPTVGRGRRRKKASK